MRTFKSPRFDKFARKCGISDAALIDAVARAERGQIDADLGGGVIKQRVARLGEGKSGGYRTIILFRASEISVFAVGFAKKDRSNISRSELVALRKVASEVLALNATGLDQQVTAGDLIEVRDAKDL